MPVAKPKDLAELRDLPVDELLAELDAAWAQVEDLVMTSPAAAIRHH